MNLSYSYASRISPVNGTGEFNLKSDSSTDVTSSIRSDYLFNTAQEEPLERVANRQLRQTISYQARTRLLDMFSDSDTSKTQETYQ